MKLFKNVSLATLVVLMACGRDNSGSKLDSITLEYNKHSSQLGSGLKTFTEQRFPSICVTNALPGNESHNIRTAELPLPQSQQSLSHPMTWSINHIKNQTELMEKLEISLAGQLSLQGITFGRGELSSRAKLVNMANFEDDFEYLLLKVKIDGPAVRMDGHYLRLKNEYTQQENETISEYIGRILMQCGDSFLSSYSLGGYFYGLVEISRSDFEIEFGTDFSLSGSLDSMGQKASTDNNVGSASQQNKRKTSGRIQIVQAGGNDKDDVVKNLSLDKVDLEGILEHVSGFPSVVNESPAIIDAHYVSYSPLIHKGISREISRKKHIDEHPEFSKLTMQEQDRMLASIIQNATFLYDANQNYMENLGERLALLSRLKRALDIRDGIVDPDAVGLDVRHIKDKGLNPREIYKTAIKTIHEFIHGCYLNYAECNIQELLDRPEVNANIVPILKSLEEKKEERKTGQITVHREKRSSFHKWLCQIENEDANVSKADLESSQIKTMLHGTFAENEIPLKRTIYSGRGRKTAKEHHSCIWLNTSCQTDQGSGTMIYFPTRKDSPFECSSVERNFLMEGCYLACFIQ